MVNHTTAEIKKTFEMEFSILSEIRESEKKAQEILERAEREKEKILHEARVNSSNMLSSREEEIKKSQEKKLMEFRDKSKLIIEEKIAGGKIELKQLKSKSDKNIAKTVELVIRQFEERI